jgi:uncharacterized membrane protein
MSIRPHSHLSANRTPLLRTGLAAILGLAVAGISPGAMAKVTICNKTAHKIEVAIAYGAKDPPGVSTGGHLGVTAEGWWDVNPGDCEQVSSIHAGNHWLYIRSESKRGNVEGSAMLCVTNKRFTLAQQFRREGDNCRQGQYVAGFKRVDTEAANFTFTVHPAS